MSDQTGSGVETLLGDRKWGGGDRKWVQKLRGGAGSRVGAAILGAWGLAGFLRPPESGFGVPTQLLGSPRGFGVSTRGIWGPRWPWSLRWAFPRDFWSQSCFLEVLGAFRGFWGDPWALSGLQLVLLGLH